MKTPLFSIITITFNAEATLEPTLQSVAAQQENDYEYLIIDGKTVRSLWPDNTTVLPAS